MANLMEEPKYLEVISETIIFCPVCGNPLVPRQRYGRHSFVQSECGNSACSVIAVRQFFKKGCDVPYRIVVMKDCCKRKAAAEPVAPIMQPQLS